MWVDFEADIKLETNLASAEQVKPVLTVFFFFEKNSVNTGKFNANRKWQK